MDLLSCLTVFLVCLPFIVLLQYKLSSERNAHHILIFDHKRLLEDHERLKSQPAPKKETLTIEAQQILHDMTAHGQAILRIVPISPTDVFWRSPG